MNDKQKFLKEIVYRAQQAGLCTKQQEFADMIGVSRTGFSSAMNGNAKFLTDSLVKKVKSWAIINGIDTDATPRPQQQTGVFVPKETLDLYTNLSETCRNLSAILRQLNAPIMDAPGKHPFLTNNK